MTLVQASSGAASQHYASTALVQVELALLRELLGILVKADAKFQDVFRGGWVWLLFVSSIYTVYLLYLVCLFPVHIYLLILSSINDFLDIPTPPDRLRISHMRWLSTDVISGYCTCLHGNSRIPIVLLSLANLHDNATFRIICLRYVGC